MAATFGETRKTATGAEWTPSENIALLSTPKPVDDASVAVHTSSPFQEPFASTSFDKNDISSINTQITQTSSRPFSPLSSAPKPLPMTPANAGSGGGGNAGGRSTPNAGGGGGGPTGGGGGHGVVNANQFVGVNFGASQSGAATDPTPPPSTPAAPHTHAPTQGHESSSPTAFQTTYSTTAPASHESHSHPTPPPHGHGHGHGHGHSGGSDPLYVLDRNTGETVPSNVPLNTFSTWSENLLAQTSGGTVASYSWDLSQAPDATNISGQNSANLQLTWVNFGGGVRTDTIRVTETPQSGSPITQTMTFDVAGIYTSGYSATRPTTSSAWPTVITPDQISSGQATQTAGPYANIGLDDGSVQTSFAMPSYNPNTTPVSLDYNSTTANAQPIFLTEYQLPIGQAVPPTIAAQLTFNNTALDTVTYNTSGLNPGDIVQIALQANATGLSTGRYPWSITVTNGSTPTTYSGNVDIVNRSTSPYGAGWSLDNIEQLVSVSGGVMLVNPDGTSLFFAGNGQSGYTTPTGDFSTLVQNQDGSYTRTLTDGTKINFNSSGQEISSVDRDGNTTTFGYTNGQLTSITDMNGQVTTLAYNSSGLLSTITDPAGRTSTLSYTGSQLTSITDPAADVWKYGYDSANDMTALTDPNNNTTSFTYNFADRVSSVSIAGNTPEKLTAMQMNGLATPGTGTPQNPATAVLLATGDEALFTDSNGNVWTYGLDWLGYGQTVASIDPLGDASLNYINPNGQVWMASDGLGRPTIDFFDGKGNTTLEAAPNGTVQQYQYNLFGEVTQYTNQNGDVTQYTYDVDGNLTQTTDALGNITTYTYNTAGLVTSTTDPDNNVTTNTYNNLDELASTTNALGGVTIFTYNNAGQLASSTDPQNYVSTYTYDAMNRLTSKILPDTPGVFSTYNYTYDKDGNQLTVTDPNNHTTTSAYNAFNKLVSTTNPLNDTTTYGYDNVGNLLSVTNPLGDETTYTYNAANEQTSMTDPGNTTTYSYDAAREQTNKTDPVGNSTNTTYTPNGQVDTQEIYDSTGTLAAIITYSYGACGCLNSISIVVIGNVLSGNVTGSAIDDVGDGGSINWSIDGSISGNTVSGAAGTTIHWPKRGLEPAGLGFTSTIDSKGNITGSVTGNTDGGSTFSGTVTGTDVNGLIQGTINASFGGGVAGEQGTVRGSFHNTVGEVTIYLRDADDRVTGVTDPQGNTTNYTRDGDGNITTATDPNGNTTKYGYNGFGEKTSSTNALGKTTSYGYNNVGELTSVTYPSGSDPSYTYDGQGRVLTATDDLGGVTSYTYDLAGNLTSVTDPDGNVTKYSYNAANEMVSMTNPQGYQSTYTYNAAGWLSSATDADGRTIDYTYNKNGQVTSETWVGGNYTATYQYNADNELISASDPNSTYTYTYNALGDVTSVSNTGTPGVPAVTLTYGYDEYGNRTSLTDSLGGNIKYAYNSDNQMTKLGLSLNGTPGPQVAFGYDAGGRLTNITRSVGGTTGTGGGTIPSSGGGASPAVRGGIGAYTSKGSLSGIHASDTSGDDIISTSYSYDQANDLTNITSTDDTTALTLASYTYGYNANGTVSSYQDNAGNSLTYGYDGNQELTSATGTLNGSSYSVNYSYDANGNRTMVGYQTGTGNELLSDGTYKYTYDHDGNMTSQTNIATGAVTYYTWDYRNRVTEVKVENSQGQVQQDETFTYDVNNNRIAISLNGTPQLYTVFDGDNPYMDFNGSGQLTERYLTNPNALNQFYGQVDANGNTQWFLTDKLGSIRQVVDTSGNVLDTIIYDPYGNILSQSMAANAPRFGYTGAAVDSITSNNLFWARPYNPANGRFLTQDWLGFAARNPNLYGYVFNSPLNVTDPSGLSGPNSGLGGGLFPYANPPSPPSSPIGVGIGGIPSQILGGMYIDPYDPSITIEIGGIPPLPALLTLDEYLGDLGINIEPGLGLDTNFFKQYDPFAKCTFKYSFQQLSPNVWELILQYERDLLNSGQTIQFGVIHRY